MARAGIAGRFPHPAPVLGFGPGQPTVRHPIAEQAGDDDAEGFEFGQAPLRRFVPASFLRGLVLRHAGHAFDLGADQHGQRLERHEPGDYRHQRHAADDGHEPSVGRTAGLPREEGDERGHVEADDRPTIEAFERHAGGATREHRLHPGASRGGRHQRRHGQKSGEAEGVRAEAPAGVGEGIGVERHRQCPEHAGHGAKAELAEANPHRESQALTGRAARRIWRSPAD